MLKKLKKYKIGVRLRKSFTQIIVIFGALFVLVTLSMMYMVSNYEKVLDNFAYPQGDIALIMNESAEVRSALRGIVAYEDAEYYEIMYEEYNIAVTNFETMLKELESTIITKSGKESINNINEVWQEYQEINKKVLELRGTGDTEKVDEARKVMRNDGTVKYNALDEALQELMDINISLGTAERSSLKIMLYIIVITAIIVIIVVVFYATMLSNYISRSIEKPLHELKERFVTFAEGDLDSPLPQVETDDEVAELVGSITAMAKRVNLVIKDAGRLLNEMAVGNFQIATEYEEQYTGTFNGLLMGIRKMNRQMDKILKGVNEASSHVLVGVTNLSSAAQSVAEGSTNQAAAVEEMQEKIEELSSGIKTTADELEKSYDEAHRYADVAEESHKDMEILMEAMARINEAAEKIGTIIGQIEDIASQTNLLSLNASIEAARAGDAGKGFAVVADQIRNLADQSSKSAVDSKELIKTAIYEIKEGNKNAIKASNSLKEVVDGIHMVANNARKMKEVSLEQSTSMQQTDKAVEKITEVVQNNSAAAQETSATSESLNAQVTALSNMISVFTFRKE